MRKNRDAPGNCTSCSFILALGKKKGAENTVQKIGGRIKIGRLGFVESFPPPFFFLKKKNCYVVSRI